MSSDERGTVAAAIVEPDGERPQIFPLLEKGNT
jgi:hypothetical protein